MGTIHAESTGASGDDAPELVVHTVRPWNSIVGFLSPFRLVGLDGEDQWQAQRDDVNAQRFDYLKLNRISGTITADIQGEKSLHIGFDGSIVLTCNYCSSLDEATSLLNELLGRLLLGGVYCEAIERIELSRAILLESGYCRLIDSAVTSRGIDHAQLRMGFATTIDLALWKPNMERFDDIDAAYRLGERIFGAIHPVSAALVIQGVTALIRRNFSSALVNLWTAAEQSLEVLWGRHVNEPAKSDNQIAGRLDLLRDTRTWTSSAKAELLFQKHVIDLETYSSISAARKARNDLVHKGALPGLLAADAAADAAFRLMSLISTNGNSPKEHVSAINHFREMDPVRLHIPPQIIRRDDLGPEGGYFVRLPAIPGEPEWEKEKANYPYSVTVMGIEPLRTPESS